MTRLDYCYAAIGALCTALGVAGSVIENIIMGNRLGIAVWWVYNIVMIPVFIVWLVYAYRFGTAWLRHPKEE